MAFDLFKRDERERVETLDQYQDAVSERSENVGDFGREVARMVSQLGSVSGKVAAGVSGYGTSGEYYDAEVSLRELGRDIGILLVAVSRLSDSIGLRLSDIANGSIDTLEGKGVRNG